MNPGKPNMRNKNNRKQQGSARRSVATGPRNLQPKELETNVKILHRFRFAASAAFSGTITTNFVGGTLGTLGTVTNTSVTGLFTSFKIRSLEMWSPPPSQGATATCSINWFSSNQSPNIEHSDTTVSTAYPAHLKSSPPPLSLASFWTSVISGANLFTLVAPAGTIIDLVVDAILKDDEASADTIAVATAVIGTAYYLALDGTASNLLVPVSLVTTH
jgi:hypothetical protein